MRSSYLLRSVVYPLEDLTKRPLPDALLLREHNLGIHFLNRKETLVTVSQRHHHRHHYHHRHHHHPHQVVLSLHRRQGLTSLLHHLCQDYHDPVKPTTLFSRQNHLSGQSDSVCVPT